MARFLLKLGAAGRTRMNMTSKGRRVFRRGCELTGTKSALRCQVGSLADQSPYMPRSSPAFPTSIEEAAHGGAEWPIHQQGCFVVLSALIRTIGSLAPPVESNP